MRIYCKKNYKGFSEDDFYMCVEWMEKNARIKFDKLFKSLKLVEYV